jgi:uncharacterized protein (DUF488 family)
VVVDVRSQPFSRFNPQFNRGRLSAALAEVGMSYDYLGDELGGRPPEPELYDASGRVKYDELARTARFSRGIDRVLSEPRRAAIMCSEEDPLRCHRRILITPALIERGLAVLHLRGDGTTVADAELAPARLWG